jgi:hypothetical protein
MKTSIALFFLIPICAFGQGTIVFDQQSSTDETPFPGSGVTLQQAAPYGQSFTPQLASVSFIRLKLYDGNINDGLGATIRIDVHANSLSGAILGSSAGIVLANNFAGTVDFVFANPIAVNPGTTYFFEPLVVTGGNWNIDAGPYNYPGGTAFYQGSALTGSDVWFREGVIVPEPSSISLILLAGGTLLYLRRGKVS